MKYFTRIAMALIFSASTAFMANAQYEQGQSDINLGVGFVTFYTGESTLPPIGVSYDYGLTDNISLGAYVGYSTAEEEFPGFFGSGGYTWTYTYIIAGLRGAYHFELSDNLDTYAGAMLGYNVASTDFESEDGTVQALGEPSVGGFAYSAFVGGRYYFTDNIGAHLELGYGIAAVQVGASFKF